MRTGLYIILLVLVFSACSQKKNIDEKELTVFCAASLTDVITEITNEFEKEYDVQIKLNLASSGTLARQIEHGAAPAIFISANKNWINYLRQLELTIPETEESISKNSMVLIAPNESQLNSFAFSSEIDLPKLFKGRISIGDPQHVPAGVYATQILEKLGCEEELGQRFLPAKDVRSALMVVELGEVEVGIVYKTDALKSDKVKIVTEFPDTLHEPVYYYMSLIKGQTSELSDNLYNFISSEKVFPIWDRYGFTQ